MFIDSHCHLDFIEFEPDLDLVIRRAYAQNVQAFVVPSTTYQSWSRVRELEKAHLSINAAYGIHPYFLAEEKLASLDLLEAFADENNAIAIGEIGLDYWPGSVNHEIQKRFLLRQLDIAQNLNLPVILHARKSYDELLIILKKYSFEGGIIHAFTGSEVQAKRFIEHGLLIGIGGSVTYPRAQKTRKMLKNLADQHFVLETDSPDMPLSGMQGQRNEPANLAKTAAIVAEIRDQDIEQIAEYTSANVMKLFRNWN